MKDIYSLYSVIFLETLQGYIQYFKAQCGLLWTSLADLIAVRNTSEVILSLVSTQSHEHSSFNIPIFRYASIIPLLKSTDSRFIQHLLGYNSLKTREIYTYIRQKGGDQIKSPLDNLDL